MGKIVFKEKLLDLDLWWIFFGLSIGLIFISALLWCKTVNFDLVFSSVISENIPKSQFENIKSSMESTYKYIVPCGAVISILYSAILQTACIAIVGYVLEDKKIDAKIIFKAISLSKIIFSAKAIVLILILISGVDDKTYGQVIPLSIGHAFKISDIKSIAYDFEIFMLLDIFLSLLIVVKLRIITTSTALWSAVGYIILIITPKLI